MAFAERLSIASPRSLHEALAISRAQRERVRWLLGTSELLDRSYALVPRDAYILDARNVPDFTAGVTSDGARLRFGAFAGEARLRAHPVAAKLLFETSPALAFAVAGAQVEVASLGRIRTRPIDALVLASYEAPVAIVVEIGADEIRLERRRTIRDGVASHELLLVASLAVADDGSIGRARLVLAIDGGRPLRARQAERRLEGQRLSNDRCAEAARLCAEAILPEDARTAAAARSALTLALALLREARTRCDAMRRRHG